MSASRAGCWRGSVIFVVVDYSDLRLVGVAVSLIFLPTPEKFMCQHRRLGGVACAGSARPLRPCNAASRGGVCNLYEVEAE
jgi:hypothetical protein